MDRLCLLNFFTFVVGELDDDKFPIKKKDKQLFGWRKESEYLYK